MTTSGPPREATRQPRRRLPVAAVTAGVLGLLVVIGSAFGAGLRFTGPRWSFGVLPSSTPQVVSPPPRPVASATLPPVADSTRPDLTWLVVVAACVAAAIIVFFVARWLLGRDRAGRFEARGLGDEPLDLLGDDPSLEASAPYLRRGLRRALDLLASDRDPSDAIVTAWLGLQEAAEDAGYRRLESETPTEFTGRILERTGVSADALATLRRLYLAVRFGDLVASPLDVKAARGALETLERDWRGADAVAHDADSGTSAHGATR